MGIKALGLNVELETISLGEGQQLTPDYRKVSEFELRLINYGLKT